MADDIRVRPAAAGDLPAVRGLLAAAQLPPDGLEDQFPAAFAVAEQAGTVVGAAGVETHGDDGLLRSVVVDVALRGRGLGERLTLERLAWARQRGLASVWLLTTTAAAFFPRLGFAPSERAAAPEALRKSKEFTGACPASAVCQRLDLRPA